MFTRTFVATAVVSLFLHSGITAATTPTLQIHVDAGKNPWTSLALPDNCADDFQFAVVADRAGRTRPGVFEHAVGDLNLLRPDFVMSIGDLILGHGKDATEINAMWDEFDGIISRLEVPFFYAAGNHDLLNAMQKEVWRERYGRAYYHFVYKNVLFLVVNSEDPRRRIGSEQIAYFRKAVGDNPGVRWTFVLVHQPMWRGIPEGGPAAEETSGTNWRAFETLLDGREYTVLAGHSHSYMKETRTGKTHIVLSTTGAGKERGGFENGQFDHVLWVTMTDKGPTFANLMLAGIMDENVRVAPQRKQDD